MDYTWANEILDKELPRLFEKRKSESEAGTVSQNEQWFLIFLSVSSCFKTFMTFSVFVLYDFLTTNFVSDREFQKLWQAHLRLLRRGLRREDWAQVVM